MQRVKWFSNYATFQQLVERRLTLTSSQDQIILEGLSICAIFHNLLSSKRDYTVYSFKIGESKMQL